MLTAMYDVWNSDVLTDRAQKAVLVTLAMCLNSETGDCFPSVEFIALKSRWAEASVRAAIRELEAAGLITTTQMPGKARHFSLHLDRLTKPAGGTKTEPPAEAEPLTKTAPLTKPSPLTESEGHPSRNRNPTPAETVTPPLTKSLPESVTNQKGNRERNLSEVFAAPADLPPDEPPFDGLFAEAEAATAVPIYETPKTKPRARGLTPKRASACPFEFGAQVPDDYRAAAEKIGLGTGDVQRVFDKFCDHARGNGKTFKDWLAAWRTWCRNEVDWGKNRRPAAAPPPRNRPMQKEDMQHYTDDF